MDSKPMLDLMESVRASAHELATRTDTDGDWNNLQSLDEDIRKFKAERLKLSLGVARISALEKTLRHLVLKHPMLLDKRRVNADWVSEHSLSMVEFVQDFKFALEALLETDKEYFHGLFSEDRTDYEGSNGDAREQ